MSDTLLVPSDVTLSGASTRLAVTFTPSGEATGDAIVLQWRGRSASVTADAWTGDAHVTQ
jgi:hypothetical protein